MAEVDTSIYRQPAQPNPLDQLTKVGQVADTLGNMEVGRGVQQALQPDGSVDQNALSGILKQTLAGSMKAIPTLDALQKLKSAGFAADQAGLETFQKRMAITHHLFGGLASKDKPTMADVYEIAAQALDPALDAKKYGITMPVVMNVLKQFRGPDGKPLPPEQIRAKALQIQSQAASTSEVLSQHSPGMQAIDRGGNIEFVPSGTVANPAVGTVVPKNLPPTATVASPTGARYLGEQPAPGPSAVRPGAPGAGLPPADVRMTPGVPKTEERAPAGSPRAAAPAPVPTGPPSSLRPGLPEAMTATATQGAAQATRLAESNDTAPGRKAILGNLEDLISKFKPGVGASWELVAKNFANRNLPVPKSWQEGGGMFDIKSVASQEEFNKLAVQLAQQQFATIGGTGTDAKFGSAIETSPNETLSAMGNKNIIKLLKGNEDAIQAKNAAWVKWRNANGPDTYQDFSADFNGRFDPRAFQFKYLTAPERQAYVDAMEPDERLAFLTNLTQARKEGWIKFDTPKAK